jgi:hypothetical protein
MKAAIRGRGSRRGGGDAERADREPRGAGGEGGPVVGAERERARQDQPLVDGLLDHRGRFGARGSAAPRPADDLAGAAVDERVQVAPAVLSHGPASKLT